MNPPPRPVWLPTTFEQAEEDVNAGRVAESHYVELKELIEGGEQGKSKLQKGLASLANDGGVFVIGVSENAATGRAEAITPVPLAGLAERAVQIARSFDPVLILNETITLRDPSDPAEGVLLIPVPASPWAPHQTPTGKYFGRDSRASYPLSDAEIADRMRRRESIQDSIHEKVSEFANEIKRGSDNAHPWIAVVIEPHPNTATDLIRHCLTGDYGRWAQSRVEEAGYAQVRATTTNPALATYIPHQNYGPQRDGPAAWRRTAEGIAVTDDGNVTAGDPPELHIGYDGSIRLVYRVGEGMFGESRSDGRMIFEWRDILGATVWAIELFKKIMWNAGHARGLAVGVHVHSIYNHNPAPFYGDHRDLRATTLGQLRFEPYLRDFYRASTVLNARQAEADLREPLMALFSTLLTSTGVPDLPGIRDGN